MAGQIDLAPGRRATPPASLVGRGHGLAQPRHVLDRHLDPRSNALRAPASTIATGRGFHVRVPSPPPR